MAKLKFLKSSSKVKVKGHKVKNFVSNGKVLSEGIYMGNMKGLAITVQKLWLRLKFLKNRSNVKVKVTRPKIFVPSVRPRLKEYTCEILKLYLSYFKSYGPG